MPGSYNLETKLAQRYSKNLLGLRFCKKLGDEYEIFVDGINGRTTDFG